jgi:hypothetical protein
VGRSAVRWSWSTLLLVLRKWILPLGDRPFTEDRRPKLRQQVGADGTPQDSFEEILVSDIASVWIEQVQLARH